MTTDVAAAHWLPPTGQGAIWDWLTDGVRLVVSYLEDESDPGSLTDYEGLIANYDLERLMLHVAFNKAAATASGSRSSRTSGTGAAIAHSARYAARAILGAQSIVAILTQSTHHRRRLDGGGRAHAEIVEATKRAPQHVQQLGWGCCASSTRSTRARREGAAIEQWQQRPGSSSRKRRRSGRNSPAARPSSSIAAAAPARR